MHFICMDSLSVYRCYSYLLLFVILNWGFNSQEIPQLLRPEVTECVVKLDHIFKKIAL